MIKPTVGRVILFHPSPSDPVLKAPENGQPFAALVAHVNDDETINVGGVDASGNHFSRQNVVMVQEGEATLEGDDQYAEWMPYQIQAAKDAETK